MKTSSSVLTRIVGFLVIFLLGVSVVSAQEATMEEIELNRKFCDLERPLMGACIEPPAQDVM